MTPPMAGGDTEVVVVGAGAAGIAAARRLRENGVDCLMVEARPRLGGRAWTTSEGSGFPLDLGCGWLHSAEVNPWREIAEAEGLTIDRTPPPWMRPALPVGFPLPDQADFREALQEFRHIVDALPEGEPDRPASAFLDPSGRWNGLIGATSTYYSGAELDRISARDLARYDDDRVNWRILEGYGTAVAAYAAGVPVRLGCPVRRIDHGGPRLKVETAEGTIAADAAIVTLPASLIAADERLFHPALPEKVEAASGLPLGLADKLFLSLADAEEFAAGIRLFGHTDRTGTGSYQIRPFGRPLIEAYFGGSLAAGLEAGGDDAFLDFALAELTGLLGNNFAHRVKPVGHHRWGADPFSRGSYSYAMPGKADCRAALAAPVDGRLFFAGEACSVNFYSTAHGAFHTGIAAADQVIAARPRRHRRA